MFKCITLIKIFQNIYQENCEVSQVFTFCISLIVLRPEVASWKYDRDVYIFGVSD